MEVVITSFVDELEGIAEFFEGFFALCSRFFDKWIFPHQPKYILLLIELLIEYLLGRLLSLIHQEGHYCLGHQIYYVLSHNIEVGDQAIFQNLSLNNFSGTRLLYDPHMVGYFWEDHI